MLKMLSKNVRKISIRKRNTIHTHNLKQSTTIDLHSHTSRRILSIMH